MATLTFAKKIKEFFSLPSAAGHFMSDKEQPPIPASDCRQYTELPRHSKPRKMKKWMVVLPSLAINGGVREALEIAAKLRISEGISHIEIISMWHATHEFTHESILQTQGLPITRLTAWRAWPGSQRTDCATGRNAFIWDNARLL